MRRSARLWRELKSSLRLFLPIKRALTHKDTHKPQTFPADSSPSVALRRRGVSAKKSFYPEEFWHGRAPTDTAGQREETSRVRHLTRETVRPLAPLHRVALE